MKGIYLVAVLYVATLSFALNTPSVTDFPTECPAESQNKIIYVPDENDCTKFYSCYMGIKGEPLDCPLMDNKGNRLHFNPVLQVCDWPRSAGCKLSNKPTSASITPRSPAISSSSSSSSPPTVSSKSPISPTSSNPPTTTSASSKLPTSSSSLPSTISSDSPTSPTSNPLPSTTTSASSSPILPSSSSLPSITTSSSSPTSSSTSFPETTTPSSPTLSTSSSNPSTTTTSSSSPTSSNPPSTTSSDSPTSPTSSSSPFPPPTTSSSNFPASSTSSSNPSTTTTSSSFPASPTSSPSTISSSSSPILPTSSSLSPTTTPSSSSSPITTSNSSILPTSSSSSPTTPSLASSSISSTSTTISTAISATTTEVSENPRIKCPSGSSTETVRIAHQCLCNVYYECMNGNRIRQTCPIGMHFDYEREICDWPEAVKCVQSVSTRNTPTDRYQNKCHQEGRALQHEIDCTSYYLCVEGEKILKHCMAGLHFNVTLQMCDYPTKASCDFVGTLLPAVDPTSCPSSDSTKKVLLPHECDCAQYYECIHGNQVLRNCSNGLYFDRIRNTCSQPNDAKCPYVCPCASSTKKVLLPYECNCGHYYECVKGKQVLRECPPNQHFDYIEKICKPANEAICATDTKPTTTTTDSTVTDATSTDSTVTDTTSTDSTVTDTTSTDSTITDTTSTDSTVTDTTSTDSTVTDTTSTNSTIIDTTITTDSTVTDTTSTDSTVTDTTSTDSTITDTTSTDSTVTDTTTTDSTVTPTESPEIPRQKCPPKGSNKKARIAHPWVCYLYYECVNGNKEERMCPIGKHFDYIREVCDWSWKVNCVRPIPTHDMSIDNCHDECSPEGRAFRHETDCSLYYLCSNGKKILKQCTAGLYFNVTLQICNYPYKNCDLPDNTYSIITQNVCSPNSTEKIRFPHNCTCTYYYECVNGKKILHKCPEGLHFDIVQKTCNDPNKSGCAPTFPKSTLMPIISTTKWSKEPDKTTTENPLDPSKCIGTCPEVDPDRAVLLPNDDCKKFCMCSNGIAWVQPCPEPLYFDSKDKVCKNKRDAVCGKRLFNQDRVSMHHRMFDEKNSLQSPNKENNDDQGIHDNSLFNHIYNFDDKTTTDKTTTENPLDPSKCIGTCPEIDPAKAVLLPNEDCKKFCMCSNGIAWVQFCPEPLYFDSKDTVCKNKRDAVCGKRLFNQDRVSMHHRMFDEKNSLQSPNKENNDDQGIHDNSLFNHIYNFDDKTTTDKTTTENPLDPSKCIGTCPEIDPAKAVLLPNDDCKKFCMCSNGIAWVQPCPEPLYFDSKDKVCKNKRDAVCGKRLFNQDRVFMHHRMFDEKNSLQSLSKENNDDQGIHDNSLFKHIYNFDDKTTTDKTTTENPLDPSKCIGTCPEIDPAKAVLLPNEDCKKFCMCSNGIAWVQFCPEPLYFDSKDTVCKNKRDAVCGKRLFNQDRVSMHHRMFDEKNSLQSPNKENNDDQGIHDNSLFNHIYNFDDKTTTDKTTTENPLDPSKCIGTCPEIDPAKAVLLPNEDCKKFCMCSNGIAWVQFCPEPLYFDSKDTVCKNKRDAVCGKRLFNQDRVSMHHRMFDEKNSLQSPNKENNDDQGIHDNSLFNHIYNFDDKTTTDKTTTENPLDPSKCIGTCPEIDPAKAVLLPNEDCKKFCMCSNGIAWVQFCPEPLYFDSKDTVCKNKRDAVCGKRLFNQDRVSMHHRMFDEKNSLQSPNKENNDDQGIHDNSLFNHIYNFDDKTTTDKTTTENPLDPSKCIGTCPEIDPAKAVLLPNEDCKKFCMCSNGIAWVQFCPEPLYFDSKDTVCKNKRDAVCGKRLFNQDRVSMHHRMFDEKNSLQSPNKENNDDQGIHDNSLFNHIYNFDDKTTTDKTTTENPLDPSKCIGTCPEIDPAKAVLLPNEDCKKFCMCSNGIAWVQFCPEPLYFDSKDTVCKNKRDAICGKRLFNQDRVSMHHRMFDEKNSLQSLNKENNDDQGKHDNSLSKHIYNFDDKTTTENPLDPSKCIGTCPEVDPDLAVLLPNEDCKKFCMCSNGIAWVQFCPEPLYFDSKDTVCKNKRDAVCGKRFFNQDRVSMHHRMFDEKNSLQSLNKENNDDQGIHDNSLFNHIYNFDDKTTTEKTTTENPLDPSKCIGTCPEIDPAKAVLLPNDDCKKFCMCSNGIAWVQPCPEPLYFDSKDKVCKNKRDAVCGKRSFN